ncbi:MAG: hypothetical protein M3O30_06920 [Planctomycetota bacterium]|nr:hypothetical protein [Planctomycetota bacterium]
MRPLSLRIRGLLLLLMLVLWVATLALWARSYFFTDQLMCEFIWRSPGLTVLEDQRAVQQPDQFVARNGALASMRGVIFVGTQRLQNMRSLENGSHFKFESAPSSKQDQAVVSNTHHGFLFRSSRFSYNVTENRRRYFAYTAAPMWSIMLPETALLLWWIRKWRLLSVKDGRRRANQCTACGYDLRATPERCPECGEVPAVLISSRQERG